MSFVMVLEITGIVLSSIHEVNMKKDFRRFSGVFCNCSG